MIAISELADEIAKLISSKTGVFATHQRLNTAVYPSCYVEASSKGISIIAGGKQVFRTVQVNILCSQCRDRCNEGQMDLCESLMPVLLPYFSVCSRRFAPQNIEVSTKSGEGEIAFTLEFCDLPPEEDRENRELMNSLSIKLDGSGL